MDKKIARVFDCQDNYSEIGFTIRTSDKYIENWCLERGLEIFNITNEWIKGSEYEGINGEITFKGKEYLLLQEPYIGNETTEYITVMQATALDSNDEKVLIKWNFVYKENFELNDYDHSVATSIEYI